MADWDKLLSRKRLRTSANPPDPYDKRSNFDSDYERVVFSSSFRRLQDKTQVFPLESHDFVRTRLTHSSEVAAVGRALGVSAARYLHEQEKVTGDHQRDWSTIVATACLLHDIGNPPFGHSGEKFIGSWFSQKLEASQPTSPPPTRPLRTRGGVALSISDPHERTDLVKFEGNAHAFRVATRIQTLGDTFGMNLTCGTLAALMKYPCSSVETIKDSGRKSRDKFGYFKSDGDTFAQVREAVGLPQFVRHPLAFLVEAADDICYSAVDIEDALKKRVISFELIEAFLETLPPSLKSEYLDDHLRSPFKKLDDGHRTLVERQQLAFQQFRAYAIGKMAASCVKVFSERLDDVTTGTFDSELATQMELAPLCTVLKALGLKHVYSATEVVKVEEAGKHVVWGLLDLFYDELLTAPESRLIKSFLPPSSVNPKDDTLSLSAEYQRAQRVADYVAGMTDTYAISLFRRLTGSAAQC